MKTYPVLVVEDVDDIRSRYIAGLSRVNIEADGAASLGEALAKIARQTYSVAVVDINLQDARSDVGDRSGHKVIRRINAMGEGTKCLVVTGQMDMESGVESYRSGMHDILLKNEIGDNLGILIEKVRNLQKVTKINPYGTLADLHAYLSKPQERSSWEYSLMSGLGLDADRFSQVIELAFKHILPIRRLKNTNYGLKQDIKDKSLSGVFWSRAIGSAVEVQIAKELPNLNNETEDSLLLDRVKFALRIKVHKLAGLNVDEFEETVARR